MPICGSPQSNVLVVLVYEDRRAETLMMVNQTARRCKGRCKCKSIGSPSVCGYGQRISPSKDWPTVVGGGSSAKTWMSWQNGDAVVDAEAD